MTKSPSVAILVLNYNGETCLPKCLLSLQDLKYSNYTVVVIDNGSQDQSLQKAKNTFPQHVYLEKTTNTGFATGMNTGIEYAQAAGYDFVWLMNYDAEVLPDTLDALMGAYQANNKIQAMSPVIKDSQGKTWFAGGHINFFRMRTEHSRKIKSTTHYQTGFLTGCAPLFKTDLLRNVGNFDERYFLYYEDADLSYRLMKSGKNLYVIPEAVVLHAEKSQTNPQKLYYLVHFGLLFFALHTPNTLRPYVVVYVTIRRLVNKIKLLLGLSGASSVAQAYADYFRKFQNGYQLYLRKLS